VRQRFVGRIRQVPPMHSALKKDGKALYEYARAGVEVERAPREVTIHELDLALTQTQQAQAAIEIKVKCSKGTYIRTLGEDIGRLLGCGGHLTRLRRTATGPFGEAQCLTLAQLEAMDEAQRLHALLPPEALLHGHVPVTLADEHAGRFLCGARLRGRWRDAAQVAVFAERPRVLLGSAHVQAGELVPERLLSPIEIQQILQNLPPASAGGPSEAP
jgi:tRNA pseudouridine55 synthase